MSTTPTPTLASLPALPQEFATALPQVQQDLSLIHISIPYREYWPTPEVSRALNLFLILHADHEQNCSNITPTPIASCICLLYTSRCV